MTLFIYITIALLSSRVLFKAVIKEVAWGHEDPDGEEIVMTMIFTTVLSALWPVVFFGYLLYQIWIKPDWKRGKSE